MNYVNIFNLYQIGSHAMRVINNKAVDSRANHLNFADFYYLCNRFYDLANRQNKIITSLL